MRMAIVSAANDAYVPAATVALRSFQKWHPELDYFILATCDRLRDDTRKYIERNGIGIINIAEEDRLVSSVPDPVYPPEAFFRLQAPELLADMGYTHTLYVDGDVYYNAPVNWQDLLPNVTGIAGRRVGTVSRLLDILYRKNGTAYDWSRDNALAHLGLTQQRLNASLEHNNGVLIWNNQAMKRIGFYGLNRDLFYRCNRCFQHDQELLSFVAVLHDLEFQELSDRFNFSFFEDSLGTVHPDVYTLDRQLRRELALGYYGGVHMVHFVYSKPWKTYDVLPKTKAYFINRWRAHARDELNGAAPGIFADLSPVPRKTFARRILRLYRKRMTGVQRTEAV